MRSPLDEPGRLSCSGAALLLEKRVSEEALSDREQQALNEHLTHCRACHNLVSWLSALPGFMVELSDAEISTAYRKAARNRDRYERRARSRKIAATIAAAAAAAAVAVFVARGTSQSVSSLEGEDMAAVLECAPAAPTELSPGILITYCAGREPRTIVENSGSIRISLPTGVVGMRVDPNRPDKGKVVVETPQGEIRVKGTVFTVQVTATDTRVEVFRGIVQFVAKASAEAPLTVAAGQGADIRGRAVFELSRPRTDLLRRALDAEITRRDAPKQDLESEDALAGGPADGLPGLADAANGGAQGETPERPGEAQPRREKAAVPRTEAAKAKVPPPTIDALIRAAQSCLIVRDWRCAASRYEEILARYPGSPESTAVLVSLAKIELRRLGKPERALRHYQTYQQRKPDGPMAEEALYGIAETYRRLGKTDNERETLRLFVERYPRSPQLERVRARLRRLDPASAHR